MKIDTLINNGKNVKGYIRYFCNKKILCIDLSLIVMIVYAYKNQCAAISI